MSAFWFLLGSLSVAYTTRQAIWRHDRIQLAAMLLGIALWMALVAMDGRNPAAFGLLIYAIQAALGSAVWWLVERLIRRKKQP